jgi:hypothetical protein
MTNPNKSLPLYLQLLIKEKLDKEKLKELIVIKGKIKYLNE